jgi:hypothetical protein
MKKLTFLFVMISFITGISTAQIQMESLDFETPQIWTSPNSPNMIVKHC